MSVCVFTYGTLSIAEIMTALAGRDLESTPAVLHGYERFLLTGRIYPGIVATPQAQTAGRLYRSVDARSLAILDLFEGDTYERREVEVVSADGSDRGSATGATVEAQAYVIPDQRRHLLSGRRWDETEFLARHRPRYLARCRSFGAQERARLDAAR